MIAILTLLCSFAPAPLPISTHTRFILVQPVHYSPNKLLFLVFERYFCVESRKRQIGMVPCTVYNTWSQKGHSRLHVLVVGT